MNLFLGMIVLIFLIAGIYFVTNTPSKVAKTKVCLVNDYEINCSDFPGDEHFCKDGVCRMKNLWWDL